MRESVKSPTAATIDSATVASTPGIVISRLTSGLASAIRLSAASVNRSSWQRWGCGAPKSPPSAYRTIEANQRSEMLLLGRASEKAAQLWLDRSCGIEETRSISLTAYRWEVLAPIYLGRFSYITDDVTWALIENPQDRG